MNNQLYSEAKLPLTTLIPPYKASTNHAAPRGVSFEHSPAKGFKMFPNAQVIILASVGILLP